MRGISIELHGERVSLLPLEERHAVDLYRAGRDEAIWRYMPTQVETLGDIQRFVREAMEERESGRALPFATFDRTLGRIVGSTRFMEIDARHRNLEIGWTWLSPEVWRTPVNTESKYLLLRHAFEAMDMIRVMFKTDARNVRSQRAIERLGAVKEGVFRHHRIMPDGYLRDSVFYSILAGEWPEVKRRLEAILGVKEGAEW